MKEIDEIAGEKHRRAATIETALREFIDRQHRKTKANPGHASKAATSAAQ